jgi:hypothetical protein
VGPASTSGQLPAGREYLRDAGTLLQALTQDGLLPADRPVGAVVAEGGALLAADDLGPGPGGDDQ